MSMVASPMKKMAEKGERHYDAYSRVRALESRQKMAPDGWIVVRVDGRNFHRFVEEHGFVNPNDSQALKLMNSCAVAIMEEFKEIIFAYGYNGEYSFVFERTCNLFGRRTSKLETVTASLFTGHYIRKWKEFFPEKDLQTTPSFDGRSVCFHTDMDVQSIHTPQKELLSKDFGIDYNTLPAIFRKGSCFFQEVVEMVKYTPSGEPVDRLRKKVVGGQCDLLGEGFWQEHPLLLLLMKKMAAKGDDPYSKQTMAPNGWIVVRVDGRNFHRFVEEHGFVKPNDLQALKLMNSCAVAIMEEFKEIIFAYGYSDEYSFVFKRKCDLFGRRTSQLETIAASLFTGHYIRKWKEFFPEKDLKTTPSFDGRSVCLHTDRDVRTNLAWRQADCMRSNMYNTCFWMLIKSGKSKKQVQRILEGIHTPEKKDLLSKEFGMDYNTLPAIVCKGSCFFHEVPSGDGDDRLRKKVVGDHCDLLGEGFWQEHPGLLDE